VAVHAGVASAESNGGVRVMPLGDSITDGLVVPGGYRIGLWQRLVAGRFTVDFVGSTIIPLGSAALEANVRTFNAAIPGIVQSKVSAGQHVHLVDMHSALTAADLADGVHPDAGGYDKMAAVWFNALQSVPGSIGNPGGGSPSPVPSSSPPPGGGVLAPATSAR
jgi:hypothetical protein